MRHVRLLVILLVVATLLVDLVVVSLVASHQIVPADWPHPAAIALFSLCVAQVSLLAIWTGLGGKSLPWRILGLLLVIGLWSRLVAWTIDRPDTEDVFVEWTWVLLGQTVVILVPLWAARLRGVRLTRASSEDWTEETASPRSRFQFSLGHLLSWITVLAIVLGLAQYTFRYDDLFWLVAAWHLVAVYGISHAALALAGFWAVFGTGRAWLRCLLLVPTTAAAIGASYLWTGIEDLGPYTGFFLLQVLWAVASLSVFRVAGYRITRIAQLQREEPPDSPEGS